MDTTIVLVVVVVFSFVVSRVLERYGRLSALSTALYLSVGGVVGPQVLGGLTSEALSHLQPVLSMLLGMLGFGLGLRLRTHLGRAASVPYQIMGALVVMVLVGAACFGFLTFALPGLALEAQLGVSATMGTVACLVSVATLDQAMAQLKARGPVTSSLRSFAVVSEVVAILSFGVVAAFVRSNYTALKWLGELTATEWVVGSALVGLLSGGLFTVFIGKESSSSRIFLATVGIVIFASGVASGLGVSPLFVSLIAGASVAALSSQTARLEVEVDRLQQPIFVLLFILAGAMWTPVPWVFVAFVPIYIGVRVMGFRLGSWVVASELSEGRRGYGGALLSQSAFAVAVSLNFLQISPAHAPLVLTTVLMAVVLQEPLAPGLVRRALADAEEIDVTFEALAEGVDPVDGGLMSLGEEEGA